MSYFEQSKISIADGRDVDSFGRLRVSNPITLFDSTFMYNKNPLVFEEIVTGGGTATFDSSNSLVQMATTGVGSESVLLQSYTRARYQPGKSHLVEVTFTLGDGSAGAIKEVGLSDEANGFVLRQNGTGLEFQRKSSTDAGSLIVPQSSWNVDKLDGTGVSGKTLDITKSQILVIDMQWLGVGRVRIGFNIDGKFYVAHEFLHANNVVVPYTATLNLPIRFYLSTSGVAETMDVICSSVQSEGGTNERAGFSFMQNAGVVAASGARTHLLSFRPKLTFNGKTNRTKIEFKDVDILVAGSSPIEWVLCIGATLTGTTTFIDVNPTYSAMEYNTAATFDNLTNGIAIAGGYVAASAQVKLNFSTDLNILYPISLDAAGNQRSLGTLSLLVSGIGGASQAYGNIEWTEER